MTDQQTQTTGSTAADQLTPPPTPFFESFQNAEVKEWASKAGFKSAEDVAALARKFDAFKDADPASLAALPKGDDFNSFVQFAQERFGAPKEANAYGLDKLENVDPQLAQAAQSWFAEAGLTPTQARHIAEKQMAWQKSVFEAQVKEGQIASERELTELKTEWGSEYDAKRELGRRALQTAAKSAGLSNEEVSEVVKDVESMVGTKAALKLFSFFGQFVKESSFVDGGVGNGGGQKSLLEKWYPNEAAKERGA